MLVRTPAGNTLADTRQCVIPASRLFALGAYDMRTIERKPVLVGGRAGDSFRAHARCRNATPMGAVDCFAFKGAAYLIASVQPSCGGVPVFSEIDPLAEISAGLPTPQDLEAQFWKSLQSNMTMMLALAGVDDAHARPMTAQVEGEHGPIWFFTATDNRLAQALQRGPGAAVATFASKGHDLFATCTARSASTTIAP